MITAKDIIAQFNEEEMKRPNLDVTSDRDVDRVQPGAKTEPLTQKDIDRQESRKQQKAAYASAKGTKEVIDPHHKKASRAETILNKVKFWK